MASCRPIPVYGYNDIYPIAGDIYEAETSCTEAHNMGQIASDNVNNLAFFSRKTSITSPKIQNAYSMGTYDPSRTYVMFSMGQSSFPTPPSHFLLSTLTILQVMVTISLSSKDLAEHGCSNVLRIASQIPPLTLAFLLPGPSLHMLCTSPLIG